MAKKRIVIVGGGVGGIAAAKSLAPELRRARVDYEITIVAKEKKHFMPPLFFDVALGEAQPGETHAPIANAEARLGVRVVVDPAVRIDAANRRVMLESGSSVEYDYLIVALGSTYEWSKYPGLAEAGHHNYTLEGALRLREALAGFRGGRVVILIPESPWRCGIYPYEAATVLAAAFKKKGIKASITLLDPGAKPAAPLGPDISGMFTRAFEEYGVEFIQHKGLEEVNPEKQVVRASNLEEKYDLLIKVPPPGLPAPLRASEGFTLSGDERFAPVRGPNFRHPDYDDVYMVGEHSMPPAGLSMAGVFVHNAAFLASTRILQDVIGFYPAYNMPVAVCAGYVGDKAFLGQCESPYDTERGSYVFAGNCYLGPILAIAKPFKYGFYKSWLDILR